MEIVGKWQRGYRRIGWRVKAAEGGGAVFLERGSGYFGVWDGGIEMRVRRRVWWGMRMCLMRI